MTRMEVAGDRRRQQESRRYRPPDDCRGPRWRSGGSEQASLTGGVAVSRLLPELITSGVLAGEDEDVQPLVPRPVPNGQVGVHAPVPELLELLLVEGEQSPAIAGLAPAAPAALRGAVHEVGHLVADEAVELVQGGPEHVMGSVGAVGEEGDGRGAPVRAGGAGLGV